MENIMNVYKFINLKTLFISFIYINSIYCKQENNYSQSLSDWPYPRYDVNNTAASTTSIWHIIDEPIELWSVTAPSGSYFGSFFPVAADIDNDNRIEYIIGMTDYEKEECFLVAFNIEDGSTLWSKSLESRFYWSSPIIVDLNNNNQLDIVLATDARYGPIKVVALNGNDASVIWEQPLPADGMGMTVEDVNNDGWFEIIVNDYGNPKRIYLLNGQNGSLIWNRETGGSAYNIPTVADLDGDNLHEILSHSHMYDPSRERLLVWDKDGNELWTYTGLPSLEQQANCPPELGWVPDFGYISTTIADLNADGKLNIGWGTRCHYYVHNSDGEVLWSIPTVEGFGVYISHKSDGTIVPDIHGTGGPSGYASAIGNIDNDNPLEIVLSYKSEYRGHRYESTDTFKIDRVTPANKILALDGKDGSIQWEFEGTYNDEDSIEYMWEPILVDLTADSMLDVLAISTDGHIYAIEGNTGNTLMSYPIDVPRFWYTVHLTFVGLDEKGILLYGSIDETVSPNLYKLHALHIAQEDQQVYVKNDKTTTLLKDYILLQNYPNPFNPVTTINFTLKEKCFVELDVFDLTGRKVMSPVCSEYKPGIYDVKINASEFPSGVYFYRLKADSYVEVKKMILME